LQFIDEKIKAKYIEVFNKMQSVSENINHKKVQVVVFAKSSNFYNVLLLKTNAHRGSFWQNITGSLEKGESFEEAALREFREETGLADERPKTGENFFDLDFRFEFHDAKGRLAIERCFLVILPEQKTITLDPHEHDEMEWIELDKVSSSNYAHPSNYRAFEKAKQHVRNL